MKFYYFLLLFAKVLHFSLANIDLHEVGQAALEHVLAKGITTSNGKTVVRVNRFVEKYHCFVDLFAVDQKVDCKLLDRRLAIVNYDIIKLLYGEGLEVSKLDELMKSNKIKKFYAKFPQLENLVDVYKSVKGELDGKGGFHSMPDVEIQIHFKVGLGWFLNFAVAGISVTLIYIIYRFYRWLCPIDFIYQFRGPIEDM